MTKKWIPVRGDLASKEPVKAIAAWAASSISFGAKYTNPPGPLPGCINQRAVAELVAERLTRVWFSSYLLGTKRGDDLVVAGTASTVDAAAGDIEGFGQAMLEVGWLVVQGSEIVYPRFFESVRSEYEPVPADQRRRAKLDEMTPDERREHKRKLAAARQANHRANKKALENPSLNSENPASNVVKLPVAKPVFELSKGLVDAFCRAWNQHMPGAAEGGPSHVCTPCRESAAAAHRLIAELGLIRAEIGKSMPTDESELSQYMLGFFKDLASGGFVAYSTEKNGSAFVPAMLSGKVIRKTVLKDKKRSAA